MCLTVVLMFSILPAVAAWDHPNHRFRRQTGIPTEMCSSTVCVDPITTGAVSCLGLTSYISCLETEKTACLTDAMRSEIDGAITEAYTNYHAMACVDTGIPTEMCSSTVCVDPITTGAVSCLGLTSYISCLETEKTACLTDAMRSEIDGAISEAYTHYHAMACVDTGIPTEMCSSTVCVDPMTTGAVSCLGLTSYISCLETEKTACLTDAMRSEIDGAISEAYTNYHAMACVDTGIPTEMCSSTVCVDPITTGAVSCLGLTSYISCLETERAACLTDAMRSAIDVAITEAYTHYHAMACVDTAPTVITGGSCDISHCMHPSNDVTDFCSAMMGYKMCVETARTACMSPAMQMTLEATISSAQASYEISCSTGTTGTSCNFNACVVPPDMMDCPALSSYMACIEAQQAACLFDMSSLQALQTAMASLHDTYDMHCSVPTMTTGGSCDFSHCMYPTNDITDFCTGMMNYKMCIETTRTACMSPDMQMALDALISSAQVTQEVSCSTVPTMTTGGSCDFSHCMYPTNDVIDFCTAMMSYKMCIETARTACMSPDMQIILDGVSSSAQATYEVSCGTAGTGDCSLTACTASGYDTTLYDITSATSCSGYLTCLETERMSCVTAASQTAIDTIITAVQTSCQYINPSEPGTGGCSVMNCPVPTVGMTGYPSCSSLYDYVTCLRTQSEACTPSQMSSQMTLGAALSATEISYNSMCSTPGTGDCSVTACAAPYDMTASGSCSAYVQCLESLRMTCPTSQMEIDAMIAATSCHHINPPQPSTGFPVNMDLSMFRSYLHDAQLEGEESLNEVQESLNAINDLIEMVEG